MNILAIETSSSLLSVAARRSDGVFAELNMDGGLRHAESLVCAIKHVFEMLGLRKNDLSLIACGLGPGSFTGLRIGLSTAKGLALGLKKKVVGVSSLDLIAQGISLGDGKLAVICDARRERIYSACYHFQNGIPRKTVKDSLFTFDQLIENVDRNTIFVGDGVPIYQKAIQMTLGRKVAFIKELFWRPKASHILSWIGQAKGRLPFFPLNHLEPTYLRLSEAEERRQAWKKKS